MKEIGSEFWLNKDINKTSKFRIPSRINFGTDRELLLSGRTAIDFVILDILKNRDIRRVYFPSYYCESMIQPFINHNFDITFYNVNYVDKLEYNIDPAQKCDVFFAINYFGYSEGRMDEYIEKFKKKGVIVIEDSTHSLLSEKVYNSKSDYIIASLRKWFPLLSGGLAVKVNDYFHIEASAETLDEMIKVRKLAMLEKGKYINGDNSINKHSYLEKYENSNKMLKNDYSLYKIDENSNEILNNLNMESIINKRKENVELLYQEFSNQNKFDFLFKNLKFGDCPIFIPIILNNKFERDSLRNYLIKNEIYCPVHWPKTNILNNRNESNINNKVISLVVDHRYSKKDMQFLIGRINEFNEEK